MTRVAAVDCGTNSIRLLVADVDPATGQLVDLDRRMTIVRLGQGVDRTGRLAPEALERTFAACRDYAAVIKELGAERLRFVATSASRDASNRDDFVRGVVDILGVEPEVITGDEEAELSFTGATKELTGRDDLAKPYLVVDIGGGSTEFVVGDDAVRAARSVNIGCVRMTERHLVRDGKVTDPPTPDQITAMRADIEAALDLAEQTVRSARPAPWSAWPARSPRSRRSPRTFPSTTRTPSTTPASPTTASARSRSPSSAPPTPNAPPSPRCTRAASTSSERVPSSCSRSWSGSERRRSW